MKNKTLKKVAIILPCWKRPNVLSLVSENLDDFCRYAEGKLDITVFYIVSNEDPHIDNICNIYDNASHDRTIVFCSNDNIGAKHNAGFKKAYELGFDYFMNLGSDNLIHKDIIELYVPFINNDCSVFGVDSLYFYDSKSGRAVISEKYNNPNVVGAGRMISRDAVGVLLNTFKGVYPQDSNRGLDGISSKRLSLFRYNQKVVDTNGEIMIVDIKNDENINSFNRATNNISDGNIVSDIDFNLITDRFPCMKKFKERKMALFINYYNNESRKEDLDFCLNKNLNNDNIDFIYLIHDGIDIPSHEKIIGFKVSGRPTISDMFSISNMLFKGIKIIANSDIYFDDTLKFANNIRENEVYALCRWDYKDGNISFFEKNDSQDAWIYLSDIVPDADFTLGKMGCDTVLAYELDKIGCKVLGRSEDILAIHVDSSIKDYAELQKGSLCNSRRHKRVRIIRKNIKDNYYIIFKFPVRERPKKFFSTLDKYYSMMSDNKRFKFIVSMDIDDESMNNSKVKNKLKKYENLEFNYSNNKTKIEACNSDLLGNVFDIVVLVSDDMIPKVKNFDNIIRENMYENFPDTDGVLWYNDGSENTRNLNTLSIMGFEYYNRFGYLYYPEYKSYWCDLEFQNVADRLNRQVFIDRCIIKHEHVTFGYGEADRLYISERDDYKIDEELYYKRLKMNFIEPIPKVAYFIWSKGTPLSYFRFLTLKTFRELHPDYKMYLYSPTAIGVKNWDSVIEQEYYSEDKNKIKDYIGKCSELDIEIVEYDKYSNLNPTQIADLFRFEKLYETGGWFFDLDQLFLSRIPESMRYNNFVIGCKRVPYIGVIGAKRGSLSCLHMIEMQQEALKTTPDDYQTLGNILLNKCVAAKREDMLITDEEVFYPVYWDNMRDLYEGRVDIAGLKNSIALHWHGGYGASQEFNKIFSEEFSKTSNDSVSRWLRGAGIVDSEMECVFEKIMDNNIWNSKESLSGTGSGREQTKNITNEIPEIIKKYNIKSMLDIPCGDYFWMKDVDLSGVDYTGADIVEKLIKKCKSDYPSVNFKVMDIVNSKLPKVDLIFCRDCLVHLPYDMIFKAIENCVNSGSKYLLTTSFKRHENSDIKLGDWRPINLKKTPFDMSPIDGIVEGCTEFDGAFSDKCLILLDLNKLKNID